MRRIYFLVPSVASARAIVNDLLLARIAERHIHVLAREGTALEDLPPARLAQTSDLVPSLERGLAAGGLTGLLAGVMAVTFPLLVRATDTRLVQRIGGALTAAGSALAPATASGR